MRTLFCILFQNLPESHHHHVLFGQVEPFTFGWSWLIPSPSYFHPALPLDQAKSWYWQVHMKSRRKKVNVKKLHFMLKSGQKSHTGSWPKNVYLLGFFFTGFKRCNHFKKLNLVPQTIYIYVTHDPNFNIYIKLWHTQIKFGNFFLTNAVFTLMVPVINAFLKSCHPFLFFFFCLNQNQNQENCPVNPLK